MTSPKRNIIDKRHRRCLHSGLNKNVLGWDGRGSGGGNVNVIVFASDYEKLYMRKLWFGGLVLRDLNHSFDAYFDSNL